MANVGSANIDITANSTQARSEVSGFFGFLKKTGSIATGVMGGLALFETVKSTFSGAISATIGANAAMEQYENTLTVVQGSAKEAAKTLDWAKRFAKETPFEIPDIVEATTRLEAYGLKAQDILGTTGDMAAVMGKPLMQAVEAVADAQTGELERLKEFGITKKMLIEQAAEMGYNEVVNASGQIVQQEQFNEALFALMKERYEGGMEIQSRSFKGLLSNASDSMGQLLTTLSKPVFEKLKDGLASVIPVMGAFTTMVQGGAKEARAELIKAFGEDTGNKIFSVFEKIFEGAAQAKEFVVALMPTFQNLKDIIVNLFPILQDLGALFGFAIGGAASQLPGLLEGVTGVVEGFTEWGGFVPIVEGVTAAIATYQFMVEATAKAELIWNNIKKIGTALQGAYTAAMVASAAAGGGLTGVVAGLRAGFLALNGTILANPLVWIPALIVGVVVALISLYNHSETFRKAVDKMWDGIKVAWEWIVDFAEKYLAPIVIGVWKEIKREWDGLVKFFSEDLPNAFHAFVGLFDDDTSDWEKIWGRIVKQTKDDGDELKKLFSEDLPKAFQDFNKWADELDDPLEDKIDEWKATARTKLEEWKTDFLNWIDEVKTELPGKLEQWGTAIRDWAEEQNEENKRQYGIWWESIQEWFMSIPDKIKEQLALWWAAFQEWFAEKKEEWRTNLEEWWTNISTWFEELPERTRTKLAEWWADITAWFIEKKEEWRTNLEEWWLNIDTWFTELPGRTRTKLDEWWTGIKTWFTETKENWKTSLEEWWTTIKEWFEGLDDKPEVKNAGKNLVDKLTEGTEEEKQTMIDKLGKFLVDVMIAAFAIAAIGFLAAGREIIKRIITGMQEKETDAENEADSLAELIGNAIKDFDWKQIGKDVVQGVINGLKSKLTPLGSAAWELGSKIVGSIQRRMDSHSPSRVMMDIGFDVGDGFIIGLRNTMSAAEKTAGAFGSSVANAISKTTKNAMKNVWDGVFQFTTNDPLSKYFSAIREDGDYMNDWAAYLPKQMQGMVTNLGKSIAPALEGLKNWSFEEFMQNYINAILVDGDWMNDWVTHLPKNMRGQVMNFGKQFAQFEGLTQSAFAQQQSGTEEHTHYWQVNADEITDVASLIEVVNGIVQTVRSR
jgi:hypothetical protein